MFIVDLPTRALFPAGTLDHIPDSQVTEQGGDDGLSSGPSYLGIFVANGGVAADILEWLYGPDNALDYTSVKYWAEGIMAMEVGLTPGQDTLAAAGLLFCQRADDRQFDLHPPAAQSENQIAITFGYDVCRSSPTILCASILKALELVRFLVRRLRCGEALETFSQAVAEYLDIFKKEEGRLSGQKVSQADIMRRCWESGAYWYLQAVNSPKGMLRVFTHHVQPLFWPAHSTESIFDQVVFPYWSIDAKAVIDGKLKDEQMYKDRLREAFAGAD